MLRLVATDLDGTLLHTDGTVTERTRAALTALEERGVTVVFVTGRPMRWMDTLWHHVGDHGLAICSNGGIVYDVAAQVVREARTIPAAVVLEVAERMRAGVPGTTFAVERTIGFAKEPDFRPRVAAARRPAAGPARGDPRRPPVKLLARHEECRPRGVLADVESDVGHLVTTTWSSAGALVEMSAAGVTKASTLALVCDERGVSPDEVVAFGDMPNDLALLEWAGTSYAMANAHVSVRELAAHVAPPNDEDGVAGARAALRARPVSVSMPDAPRAGRSTATSGSRSTCGRWCSARPWWSPSCSVSSRCCWRCAPTATVPERPDPTGAAIRARPLPISTDPRHSGFLTV